jgi:hypothetical protein
MAQSAYVLHVIQIALAIALCGAAGAHRDGMGMTTQLLQLRGGGESAVHPVSAPGELVFPHSALATVQDAVKVAVHLRRPLQIQRGVHRW